MQFRLKTLFVVATVLSVIVGIVILRYQYRWKSQAHYDSFVQLHHYFSGLDQALKAELQSWPVVLAATRTKSPTPENYLSGGYGATSNFGSAVLEQARFSFGYEYQWPDQQGKYDDRNSVDITASSVINMDSFDKHVVILKYKDTEFNRTLADWLERKVNNNAHVTVKHHTVE